MYLNEFATKANTILKEYPEPVKYLNGRGISQEDIDKFTLGFVKIASVKDDGTKEYTNFKSLTNKFKNLEKRILFPLKNVLGKVHGISTRLLDQKSYVHYFLPEAKKIGAFFGLYEALPYICKTRKVFIHEGSFNSISFSKVFPNTIASLTSFLNAQQYETLCFFVDKIVLVYDQDKAGLEGVQKCIEMYGDKIIDYVCIGENDANAYYQMQGPAKFEKYIRSKIPLILQDS